MNRAAEDDRGRRIRPFRLRPPRAGLLVRASRLRAAGDQDSRLYTAQQYLQVFALAVLSALGIFYISTFIDLADKLFRGSATTSMLLQFFYYQTPQYLYYIIPIAVLVATLVTIGVMTKNSELVVMKACGISLYRAAAPLLIFAVVASVALFGLQEVVLARANRRAVKLNGAIRGCPSQEPSAVNRWISSESGDIYHYDLYDPGRRSLHAIHAISPRSAFVAAERDDLCRHRGTPLPASAGLRDWTGEKGWVRTLRFRARA